MIGFEGLLGWLKNIRELPIQSCEGRWLDELKAPACISWNLFCLQKVLHMFGTIDSCIGIGIGIFAAQNEPNVYTSIQDGAESFAAKRLYYHSIHLYMMYS